VELSGKNVTVVGLGKSGLAAVRFLASRGAHVRVNDQRQASELGEAGDEVRRLGVELVTGGHPREAFDALDLVVVSPGVPSLEVLEAAEARGIPVISEIELAARFIDAPIVAVTGTNGKSTVTTLIGEMCRTLGRPIFVGGNLGDPMVEAVGSEAAGEGGLVIVELSSFQLERVAEMRAHVAVLLNVSADHLDRYPSFEAYAAAKARIFERQSQDDFAILPDGASELRELLRGNGRLATFGAPNGSVRVDAGAIVDSESGLRVQVADVRLRGSHNLSNASAAALAARLVGVGPDAIASVLREFGGLPHRMQYVATVDGVEYIDDSKATNVGAAVAALAGLEESGGKIVLIAGGVDKGGSYAPLRARMDGEGRAVVVLGEAAPLIEQAFSESRVAVERAESMQDAVDKAAALAAPGDTVLLAPACSSFDMFRSYAQRGDVFQEAVESLGGQS
jgi:UDP-N-acetylmuramoylalanine--D-glutamate ligase